MYLQVWRINTKYNILYVHGPAVPGPNHCYVRVMDTRLRYRRVAMANRGKVDEAIGPLPMPTFFPDDVTESMPEELFDKDLFQFAEPSITYPDEPAAKTKSKVKSS